MSRMIKVEEPLLQFGYDQSTEDPRDGLLLFGPRLENRPFGISYGLVGTEAGISRFKRWLSKANQWVAHDQVSKRTLWIPFPGFEEVYGIPFAKTPTIQLTVDYEKIREALGIDDEYQRVYQTVDLYVTQIINAEKKSDEQPALWFVVSPESVFEECRPKSKIDHPIKRVSRTEISRRKNKANQFFRGQELIFADMQDEYPAYQFDTDFRRQLKARLILAKAKSPIQIIRESTLTSEDFVDRFGNVERELQPLSQVAWNLFNASFYKAGGKPWRLNSVRDGVCYLGMVFKKLTSLDNDTSSCCAAQMFLDSGDGVVFQGAVGPWKSEKGEEYHLDENAAREIVERAVQAYREVFGNKSAPKEIFVHGRTYLNEEEWKGFSSIESSELKVIGIRIRHSGLRLFRQGRFPVLRGTALIENPKKAYLYTTGFVPRLRTYPYQGFPAPLSIEVVRGEKEIETVLADILALTKLNYNSCHFGDGEPITLKFADKIGEILTAGPIPKDDAPLSFKYYI